MIVLVGPAFLWIAMVPAVVGSFARRRNWPDVARFCDGLAYGFAVSGLIVMLVVVRK